MIDPSEIQRLKSTADLLALFEADGVEIVREGARVKCACPFHNERTPSCYLYDNGSFHCFGCGAHGDAIEYLMQRRGLDFAGALQVLGAATPITKPRRIDKRVKYQAIMPIPANAPKCSFEIAAAGVSKPQAVYWYLSATGQRLMAVVRYLSTNADGEAKKTIRPWCWARRDSDGSSGWQMTRPDDHLPLYGLDVLASKPDMPVLIVEGEKAADAARQFLPFHAVITWCGGSKAVTKTEWSPLSGRDVILWPDYDYAGAKAMLAVADELRAIGVRSISAIDLRGLEARVAGWDVADGTAEDAEIIIGMAKPDADKILASLVPLLPGQPTATENRAGAKKQGAGNNDNNGQSPTERAHSDDGNIEANDIHAASRFVADNKGKVLYCPAWDRWHVWDGKRWRGDDQGLVFQLAEATALRMARDYIAEGNTAAIKARDNLRQAKTLHDKTPCTSEDLAKAAKLNNEADALRKQARNAKAKAEQVQSLKRMRDMLELAKTRAELIVQVDELDADAHLLNCNTGVINLQTGDVYKHDSKRRITRLAPIDYEADAPMGELEKVLNHLLQVKWTDFDVENKLTKKDHVGKINKAATAEMIEFAQNILGNSLQGNNRLERFYVWQGPGGSGKGTLHESIKAAIGDYCMTAEFQSFVKTQGHRVRDDLARLAEARVVLASEAEQGEQMAAGVLKAITGRDTITARQLYGTYFEFRPRLTLHLQCNDLPRADDQDSGLWRRLVLIPCGPQIPDDKRDPHVKDWLFDPERGGKAVLAWLVAGAIRTYSMKTIPEPLTVRSASLAYRKDQDPTKEFFTDCLRFASPKNYDATRVGVTDLLKAYAKWCDENQLQVRLRCSPKTIAHRLENLGCYRTKRRVGKDTTLNAWIGVTIPNLEDPSVPTTYTPDDDEHCAVLGVPQFRSSADLGKGPTDAHAHARPSPSDNLLNLEEQRNSGTDQEPPIDLDDL